VRVSRYIWAGVSRTSGVNKLWEPVLSVSFGSTMVPRANLVNNADGTRRFYRWNMWCVWVMGDGCIFDPDDEIETDNED
jgi:hypothetical protein